MTRSSKSGRYSGNLPARVQAHYEEGVADPNLLSLRDDVALSRARVADLCRRLDEGGATAHWKSLKEAWAEFKAAVSISNETGSKAALASIGRIISAGAKDEAVWDQLAKSQKDLADLTTRENNHIAQLHQMMTVEQAMIFVSQIERIVMENVPEKDRRIKIAMQFREVMQPSSGIQQMARMVDVHEALAAEKTEAEAEATIEIATTPNDQPAVVAPIVPQKSKLILRARKPADVPGASSQASPTNTVAPGS